LSILFLPVAIANTALLCLFISRSRDWWAGMATGAATGIAWALLLHRENLFQMSISAGWLHVYGALSLVSPGVTFTLSGAVAGLALSALISRLSLDTAGNGPDR